MNPYMPKISLNDMADRVHDLACQKGWWPSLAAAGATPSDPAGFDVSTARRLAMQDKPFPQAIALLHEEVSEAFRWWKKNPMGVAGDLEPHIIEGKPEGVPSELADILIRLLDMAAAYRIDLDAAVAEKHHFNRGRTHRHGGKIA